MAQPTCVRSDNARAAYMFVRRKVAKGNTYYAVVQSYRDGTKVRHRSVAALGTCPTVEDAVAAAEREIKRRNRCLRKPAGLFPAGAPAPPSATKEMGQHAAALSLQQQRLARLRDVATMMATEAA